MPIDVYTSFNQTNKMTVVHIDLHTQEHTGLLLTVHVTLLLLLTPMLSSVQLQTIQFGVVISNSLQFLGLGGSSVGKSAAPA